MKKSNTVSIEGIVIEFEKMELDNNRVYVWRKNMVVFSYDPKQYQLKYFGSSELNHFDLIKKEVNHDSI